jgi:hypothetical protein
MDIIHLLEKGETKNLDLLEKGETKNLHLLEKGETKNIDLAEKGETKNKSDLAQPLKNVDDLPSELIMLIKTFLPKSCLLFLNNYYYKKYHYLVKKLIGKNQFENYIRKIVRSDNDFVFSRILFDYHKDLSRISHYVYKNVMYKKYFYFLIEYCISNDSVKCRNMLNEFLKVQGLCQNRHKKNPFIHIRWKH